MKTGTPQCGSGGGGGASSRPDADTVESLFESLLSHGHHEDVVFAAECLSAGAERCATAALAHYYLAKGYHAMGRPKTAYDVLRRRAPASPPALYLLAKCCFETDRLDEARAVLLGDDPCVPPAVGAGDQMAERFGASAPFAHALLARVQASMCAPLEAVRTARRAVAGNPLLWSAAELCCKGAGGGDEPHAHLARLLDTWRRRFAGQPASQSAAPASTVATRLFKTPRGPAGAKAANDHPAPIVAADRLSAPVSSESLAGGATPDVFVQVESTGYGRPYDVAPAAPKKNAAASRRNARASTAAPAAALGHADVALSRTSSASSVGSSTAGALLSAGGGGSGTQRMTRSNSRAAAAQQQQQRQQAGGGGNGQQQQRSAAALHQRENMRGWARADEQGRRSKRLSNTAKENASAARRNRALGTENRSTAAPKPIKIEESDLMDCDDKRAVDGESKAATGGTAAAAAADSTVKGDAGVCGDLLEHMQWLVELRGLLAKFELDAVIERCEGAGRDCLHTQLCRAKAYYEKTMYDKCVEVYECVAARWPHSALGMEYYSTALWQLQRSHELSALAQRLVERSGRAAESWCAAGNCYSLHKEHELAIRMLNRAIALQPDMSYAYTLLGHEYRAINELDKAAAMFQRSAHLDARNYAAWYGLSLVHYSREQLQLALTYTRKALDVHPRNSVLLCHAGLLMAARGRHDDAMRTLEGALHVAPDNIMCRYRRAELLFADRRFDEALAELNRLKEVAPREASVYYLAGQVYKVKGQSHLAVMNFSWSTELDPRGEHSSTLMATNRLAPPPHVAGGCDWPHKVDIDLIDEIPTRRRHRTYYAFDRY